MDLQRLSKAERLVAAAGTLLVVDLLFLPWHSFRLADLRVRFEAVEAPNRFFGILAVTFAAAIVATVVVRRLTPLRLPEPPVPWSELLFYAAVAADTFLFLKLLQETSGLGYGSWLAFVLAGVMTYGAHRHRAEGPL